MGVQAPIQVPSAVSNLKTLPEVVRFLGAFAIEVATKFNSLVANKECYGAFSGTGIIGVTGSGDFGVSFVSTGIYWVAFRVPYFTRPVVQATASAAPFLASAEGITTTGFSVRTVDVNGNLLNIPVDFFAKGPK